DHALVLLAGLARRHLGDLALAIALERTGDRAAAVRGSRLLAACADRAGRRRAPAAARHAADGAAGRRRTAHAQARHRPPDRLVRGDELHAVRHRDLGLVDRADDRCPAAHGLSGIPAGARLRAAARAVRGRARPAGHTGLAGARALAHLAPAADDLAGDGAVL